MQFISSKQMWIRMLLGLCCLLGWQQAAYAAEDKSLAKFNRQGDFESVKSLVIEQRTFFGLASYYNAVSFYRVTADGIEALEPGQSVSIAPGERFAAVGRFNVLVLDKPGTRLDVGEETFRVIGTPPLALDAQVVSKTRLNIGDGSLDQLRYHHLWWPFAQLALAAEWSLVEIRGLTGVGWGVAIVLFTILLKILMVPLGIVATHMQGEVSRVQSQLMPKLAEIKASYDGEEAHNRIMAAHKELGVSTFFALKPLLVTFIQVPIWVGVFNALGEMPQLSNWGFLWIESLAYADSIATLPVTLPLFGNSLNLLPILMTVVTVVSALLFQDSHAHPDELKRQKRNLYLMALAFLVLFYPFPAAMVLYWTLSNALQIVQQRFVKV